MRNEGIDWRAGDWVVVVVAWVWVGFKPGLVSVEWWAWGWFGLLLALGVAGLGIALLQPRAADRWLGAWLTASAAMTAMMIV